MHSDHNIGRARNALGAIPSDIPREQWIRVAMAAKDAGLSFEDFDKWSAPAKSYNAKACRTTWHSFKTVPGGVTAGTLFSVAREFGWVDGENHRLRIERTQLAPNDLQRKPIPGMGAAEVFERSGPATYGHPYIAQKSAAGVPLDGLRVVPADDPLTIQGRSMAGALVVPAYAPSGEIQSLQLIPREGKGKLNLPGSAIAGASFTVGTIKTGEVIYVVEGIGTAWACWQATKAPAVSCFGAGNVRKVTTALREKYGTNRLVLVPDVGKEVDAAKIAIDLGCAVVNMPAGEVNNFDAHDLKQRDGAEALEALLLAPTEPPKPTPLLKSISVGDVLSNPAPPTEFIWDGYLPRGVVSLLGAHGGTGKSTIALMLAVSASLGRPLFGVSTVRCKALFVSLEDSAQIVRHRLAFICRTWGINPAQLDGNLHIVDGTENPELFSADSRGAGETTATYFEMRKLVQLEGMGLVVVDNASDAYGGDEIQRRQVRAFMRALVEVARLTNCAVLLLAHVDKNTSRVRKAEGGEGYSGSTAWHNSARSRLFMTRTDKGTLTLEHQKSNLGKLRDVLALEWLDVGLPQLVNDNLATGSTERLNCRADDDRAIALLKLIADFEVLGQYCSPAPQARNNVHALLRSEPAFLKLKLGPDDTKRIVNQCQRAKWIEPLEYKSAHTRKYCQRWTITNEGRIFAGLPAPSSPTAPTCHVSAETHEGAVCGAPTAPTYTGGVGEKSAHTELYLHASAMRNGSVHART